MFDFYINQHVGLVNVCTLLFDILLNNNLGTEYMTSILSDTYHSIIKLTQKFNHWV